MTGSCEVRRKADGQRCSRPRADENDAQKQPFNWTSPDLAAISSAYFIHRTGVAAPRSLMVALV